MNANRKAVHRPSFVSRARHRIDGPLDRRLRLEPLEDRRMLAVITVESLDDSVSIDGMVTLREAISAANLDISLDGSVTGNGADTIVFDAALSGQTITLVGVELLLTEAVTIDATALPENVIIDADLQSRIFNIVANAGDFTLAGLTLTGGRTTGSNAIGADSTFSGGAIRSNTSGSLTIDQSTVSGNGTAGTYAEGGGIFSLGAVTLTQSTVGGNFTSGSIGRGGGIGSDSDVTLIGSTLSGNSTLGAGASGGGIRTPGAVTLISSTLSGNRTTGNSTSGFLTQGGGISTRGNITITHSTVTGNRAQASNAEGGGVWNFDSPIVIRNSIIADNFANGGMDDIRPGTGTLDVDYSLIEQVGLALVGSGNIIGLPAQLGPLAFNGGMTQTHTLLAGSPAIDAGDPNLVFNSGEFDQRGAPFVRVFDNPLAVGTSTDMGAHEVQTLAASFFVVATPVDIDDSDYSAGELSLRESLRLANGNPGMDTITFSPTVFDTSQVMLLNAGELKITEAITIDGPGQDLLTVDAQQESRVLNFSALSGDLTIEGLTLQNGKTTGDNVFIPNQGPDSTYSGGGIRFLSSGDLTLTNSTLSGNSTTGESADGGGIYTRFGTVVLTGSTVSGNSTAGTNARGGGIQAFSSSVTLNGSTVTENSTTGNSSIGGGIVGISITAIQSNISRNSTTGNNSDGGGIFAFGELSLNDSTISGNSTAGENSEGGGLYARGAVTTILDSTIAINRTLGPGSIGGGLSLNLATGEIATISGSTISGNRSADNGGGLYAVIDSGAELEIINSTVSANFSDSSGGGLFLAGTDIAIAHSTIAFNTADADSASSGSGGGIFVGNGSSAALDHTIVSNNVDLVGTQNDLRGAFDADYSLIGDTTGSGISGANNLLNVDPRLRALSDAGGSTLVHALGSTSQAINAGRAGALPGQKSVPLFDQRGDDFGRVQNARIDIGAFEVSETPSADFDQDGDIDGSDFLNWQRGFGTPAPTAIKSDGDADNDLDTDGNDLSVWQLQLGTTPLLTAVSTQLSTVALEPIASADLIDAALAIEWLGAAAKKQTAIKQYAVVVEAVLGTSDKPDMVLPTVDNASDVDSARAIFDRIEPAEETWLADEILERVFG